MPRIVCGACDARLERKVAVCPKCGSDAVLEFRTTDEWYRLQEGWE